MFFMFVGGGYFQGAVETEMTLTPPLEPAAARASSSAMPLTPPLEDVLEAVPLTPPLEDVLMSSPESQQVAEDPYQTDD